VFDRVVDLFLRFRVDAQAFVIGLRAAPLLVLGQARKKLLGEVEALVFRQGHRVFEELAGAIGHR